MPPLPNVIIFTAERSQALMNSRDEKEGVSASAKSNEMKLLLLHHVERCSISKTATTRKINTPTAPLAKTLLAAYRNKQVLGASIRQPCKAIIIASLTPASACRQQPEMLNTPSCNGYSNSGSKRLNVNDVLAAIGSPALLPSDCCAHSGRAHITDKKNRSRQTPMLFDTHNLVS